MSRGQALRSTDAMMVTMLPIGRGGAEPHRCGSLLWSCAAWDEQIFAATLGRDLWYGENQAVVKDSRLPTPTLQYQYTGVGPPSGGATQEHPCLRGVVYVIALRSKPGCLTGDLFE
jgi:hypothetical protein